MRLAWEIFVVIGAPLLGVMAGVVTYVGGLPRLLVAFFVGVFIFGANLDLARSIEEYMGWEHTRPVK